MGWKAKQTVAIRSITPDAMATMMATQIASALRQARIAASWQSSLHVELNEAGIEGDCHRTARFMRQNGLTARQKTRCQRTKTAITVSLWRPTCSIRTGDRPDQKSGEEISDICTREGWLYLAIVVDLYSRQIDRLGSADPDEEGAYHPCLEQSHCDPAAQAGTDPARRQGKPICQ